MIDIWNNYVQLIPSYKNVLSIDYNVVMVWWDEWGENRRERERELDDAN